MRRLNEFIEGVKLFDLPLLNGKFTWVNCRARSRIDRFLLSSDWLDLLKEVGQVAGLRVTSDHWLVIQLILTFSCHKWGPCPFCFENMWLQHPSFKPQISGW